MTTPPPPAPAPGPLSSSAPGREPIVDEFTSAVARLGIRRTTEGWVGGVCDGIAWRWSIDPVVVRVAFIVLALFGGFGIAVYAAGWLLLPAPDGPSVLSRISASAGHAVALLALAGLALVVIVFSGSGLYDPQGWGLSQLLLLLIIGGVGYAALRSRSGPDTAPPPAQPTPPGGAPGTHPTPLWPPVDRVPAATGGGASTVERTLPDPVWPDPGSPGLGSPDAAPPSATGAFVASQQISPTIRAGSAGTAIPDLQATQPADPATWQRASRPAGVATALPPPVAPRLRRRRLSAWVALVLTGLGIVVATMTAKTHESANAAGSSVTVGLAAALALFGAALLIAGLTGRRGGLTTLVALLLAVATGASAMASNPAWSGGIGERTWGASDGSAGYRLGLGTATLNLDEPVPAHTDRLSFPVRIVVGEFVINLPATGTTTVTVDARVGSVSEDGKQVASNERLRFTRTYGTGDPKFVVDVTMTVGDVRIEGVRK